MSQAPGRLALVMLLVAAPAFGAAATRRAFVTATQGTGKLADWPNNMDEGLTGLAAANRICENSALDADLGNESAFRAWISTTTTSAFCNVQGFSGHPPNCNQGSPVAANIGPWRMANSGTFFADSLADIVDSSPELWQPLSRDQFFNEILTLEDSYYWTGTLRTGTGSGAYCGDWTVGVDTQGGTKGSAFGTSVFWTHAGDALCGDTLRLLCLENGEGLPLELQWTPGSLVFVTFGEYPADLGSSVSAGGETGLAAGDAICVSRAAAGRLPAPESFVAWLSDSQADAAERVTSNGPFRRIDGITVALTKATLTDGGIDSTIHQTEVGLYVPFNPLVWTGTDANGVATGADCGDWKPGSLESGDVGAAGLARSGNWTDHDFDNCNEAHRLYCFSNVVTLFWDGFDYSGDTSRWSDVQN